MEIIRAFPDLFELKSDSLTPPNYWLRICLIEDKGVQRRKGKIKRFLGGYGFIEADDGNYFFTVSNVLPESRAKRMRKDLDVEFEVFKSPSSEAENSEEKNGKAKNVQIL